jgi:hypothetical protein
LLMRRNPSHLCSAEYLLAYLVAVSPSSALMIDANVSLRGFLIIFELIQLIKLAMVSVRRLVFNHTPREIREMTKPAYFEYSIVIVNLLWVCAVGLIYAPLAPLVTIGATLAFWFSSVVYKYQLLYVYISRAESGGRMWNVYVNRLIACAVLMQLLMVLSK